MELRFKMNLTQGYGMQCFVLDTIEVNLQINSVDLELLPCQYLFSHLKPSVIFVDGVSKIYSFSLAHKLAKLWLILHAQVVSHKIAIDAISAALFGAIQNVGGLKVKTRFKNVKIYIIFCY